MLQSHCFSRGFSNLQESVLMQKNPKMILLYYFYSCMHFSIVLGLKMPTVTIKPQSYFQILYHGEEVVAQLFSSSTPNWEWTLCFDTGKGQTQIVDTKLEEDFSKISLCAV